MQAIYRVQNKKGRGPYIPGFSDMWSDPDRQDLTERPAFYTEFKSKQIRLLHEARRKGLYVGCGFRTLEQLRRWFSDAELTRLKLFGFRPVKINVDHVLAESDRQLVFSRKKPLNKGTMPVKMEKKNESKRC